MALPKPITPILTKPSVDRALMIARYAAVRVASQFRGPGTGVALVVALNAISMLRKP